MKLEMNKHYLLAVVDALIVFTLFIVSYIFRIVVYEGGDIQIIFVRFSPLVPLSVVFYLSTFYIFDSTTSRKHTVYPPCFCG